ncbi:replicative DNA helicase [Parabacteroides goldsteinii]|uniref:replicative DNA helicase n=1 Tax=Parabacteroides goldsteinii TaxID=328812 RepID=UPI002A801E91|nr:replicative DNA helicase [Parabacteroides goldsteinii]
MISLPHSEETEKAVIGALLIESGAIGEVVGILNADIFYDVALGKIYSAIASLYENNIKPDLLTVTKTLIRSGELKKVGGPFFLSTLSGNIASTANIVDHAQYLHQLWLARKLAIAGMEITKMATDPTADIDDVLTAVIKKIEGIAENTAYNSRMIDISTVATQCISEYEKRREMARNGGKIGLTTGLSKLDHITGGWKPGQLIILAARPAMGKTAMLLHFAKSASISGVPVVIFSLEMEVQALTNRALLSESEINSDRFKAGTLLREEEEGLCHAIGRISCLPISLDDSANINMRQIKTRARELRRKGKCGLILIDYLQLIDMRSANRNYTREQEVSQCSRAAKIMAKELGVPVILLSQLSRQVEGRADKMPMLSDLRESGAIEQDADIVMFIHRPEYYSEKAEKGFGVIRIAKQRDGATGDIRFRYNENLTKITDYDKELPF